MLGVITLLVVALLLFYKYSSYRKSQNYSLLPPGPTPLPIFGCLFQVLTNKPAFRWIHKFMDKRNTDIACIRLGRTHVIPVRSPELAREFLKNQDIIFLSRPTCMSGRVASGGYYKTAVMAPIGDQWKKMRKILTYEVLSQAKHCMFHDKRNQEADHLVRYIYGQCRNSTTTNGLVSLRSVSRHYCGNVMRRMTFSKRFFKKGAEDGGPGVEEEEHVTGLFTLLEYLYGFCITDFLPWFEVFDFDGYKRTLNKSYKNVAKYQDQEIDERILMWKSGIKTKEDDILDILINLKDPNGFPLLTAEEIKAQITEIMMAIVDNPSNALEWAMAEMVNQPSIFLKAQTELDEVVGKDRLVQEYDLPKLNYVKACAKESFRLHPISAFNVPHVSIKDTFVANYFIPKGSRVLLSRPGLGRNSRVWDEPLKYIPERHIRDDGSDVVLADQELRMLSFSTGRRGCPAVLLGSTVTLMLFARLIQGFSWSAPHSMRNIDLVESQYDMSLAKPLLLIATPRLNVNVYHQLQN